MTFFVCIGDTEIVCIVIWVSYTCVFFYIFSLDDILTIELFTYIFPFMNLGSMSRCELNVMMIGLTCLVRDD